MSHQIDRINITRISVTRTSVLFEVIHHFLGYLLTNMCPCIKNLVVPLTIGDNTTRIELTNLAYFFVSLIKNFGFVFRRDEIICCEGKATIRAPAKANTIHIV